MSDLHCPATVILASPESIRAGRVPRPLTSVFVAAPLASHPAAAELARSFGFAVEVLAAAVDAKALREAVNEVADNHRGYTVAVVASRAMIEQIVGRDDPVTVTIDSSGWTVT
jgi:hypothetical protein